MITIMFGFSMAGLQETRIRQLHVRVKILRKLRFILVYFEFYDKF